MISKNLFSFIPGGANWFILIICFIGYSTLNRGFAYIGHYPIFVGEIALLFYIVFLRHNITLPLFLRTRSGKLLLLYVIYCIVIFIYSSLNDFSESLRNSVFWVYSLFFYIGYLYGNRIIKSNDLEKFYKVLSLCAKISVLYYALYPFRQFMLSSTLILHNKTTSLVGYYSTLHAISLGFILFLLFYRKSKYYVLWIASGILFVIAISQSRASILAACSIFVYLFLVYRKKRVVKQVGKFFVVALFIVIFYGVFGFQIKGEKGLVSIESVQNIVVSIFVSKEDFEYLEGSRSDRLDWWSDVIRRTTDTTFSSLFGLGFDEILVNRPTGDNTILRYPHNSFVTLFGLTGIVGLLLYCMIIYFVVMDIRSAKNRGADSVLISWYPVFLIGYLVSAFFSTVFEAPFHSFIFWIITGITYRDAHSLYSKFESSLKRIT